MLLMRHLELTLDGVDVGSGRLDSLLGEVILLSVPKGGGAVLRLISLVIEGLFATVFSNRHNGWNTRWGSRACRNDSPS